MSTQDVREAIAAIIKERDSLRAVNAELLEAMKEAVSANNFRAACLCSDAPMQKIDFAETAFWRAMDNLAARAAIASARKQENHHG